MRPVKTFPVGFYRLFKRKGKSFVEPNLHKGLQCLPPRLCAHCCVALHCVTLSEGGNEVARQVSVCRGLAVGQVTPKLWLEPPPLHLQLLAISVLACCLSYNWSQPRFQAAPTSVCEESSIRLQFRVTCALSHNSREAQKN